MNLMNELHDEYGEHFSQIFKTITVDNGSEFADFAKVEKWGTKAFFAHPYTAWERPQNEHYNGLFRAFVPRGASLEQYTLLLQFAKKNEKRKKLLQGLCPATAFLCCGGCRW